MLLNGFQLAQTVACICLTQCALWYLSYMCPMHVPKSAVAGEASGRWSLVGWLVLYVICSCQAMMRNAGDVHS